MRRWLFFATTPVQVVNAIAIARQLADEDDVSSWLLVNAIFDDVGEHVGLARRSGAFREVGVVCLTHPVSRLRRRMRTVRICLGPIRRDFFPTWLFETRFDRFAVASLPVSACEVSGIVSKCNRDVKMVFFEDGSGTYDGNVFTIGAFDAFFGEPPHGAVAPAGASALKRRVKGLLYGRRCDLDIAQVWVKRPDLLAWESPWPVMRFSLDAVLDVEGACALAPRLEPLGAGAANIIILEPPRGTSSIVSAGPVDAVMSALGEVGLPFMRRAHPSSVRIPSLPECATDVSGGSWELICHRNSLEDAVLVSMGSSSMLSPLVECGKRPHLVFLHRMLPCDTSMNLAQQEKFMSVAARAYGDVARERLHAPETLDEAVSLVTALAGRRPS